MIWTILSFISAALLGVYDIFKKKSLQGNAVLPVLFASTTTGAMIFTPFIVLSHLFPQWSSGFSWYIPPVSIIGHLLIFLKSIIVGSSWVLAYFAIKHLPITIVSPIRSSGPLWTLLGGLFLFGELLNLVQWIGLVITLVFYYLFSFWGKKEGIHLVKNKWALFMVLATLVGSISALYDKFLIAEYNQMAIQAWFMVYLVLIFCILLLFLWYPQRHQNTPFQWRWTIPLIGLCLVLADYLYFKALAMDGALISIVSTIRRASIIFSFTLGAILFKEKNIRAKALILLGILTGILIIIAGGK